MLTEECTQVRLPQRRGPAVPSPGTYSSVAAATTATERKRPKNLLHYLFDQNPSVLDCPSSSETEIITISRGCVRMGPGMNQTEMGSPLVHVTDSIRNTFETASFWCP